jgi:hypothetical protein
LRSLCAEASLFFVREGEDKTAEQEEEDHGLMAGDEESQWGAIEDVDDLRRADTGEMMEDDSERRNASQRVQLVETADRGLSKLIEVTRHNH